jgi:two-component system, cell cycle sensor histidine kinase and response regulator CckA
MFSRPEIEGPLSALLFVGVDLDSVILRELSGYKPEIISTVTTEPLEFASALKTERWQIVIFQFPMPDVHFSELCAIIRSKNQEIAFICVSDEISEEKLLSLSDCGVVYVPMGMLKCICPVVCQKICHLRSIRRIKFLEEKLRQTPKLEALGRLAGGVAHDFNNVLATIVMRAEQLLEEMPSGFEGSVHLDQILKAGDRGSGLTRQLLAFARNQVAEPQILNLNSVVSQMEKMLKPLIGEDIDLVINLEPKLRNVIIDPVHLEQLIMNLIVNSRDAVESGGQIRIATGNVELTGNFTEFFEVKRGPYSMLSVADNGCGMDALTQSKMFEPFFTTKGERGSGLGLSMVFGIVKQHQGYIIAKSEVGEGTSFEIYLPSTDLRSGVIRQAERSSSDKVANLSILLVEDDELLGNTLSAGLKRMGHQVLLTKCPIEAIRIARQADKQSIDVLLTDVVMPSMTGVELAQAIVKVHPNLKILFMSGYGDMGNGSLDEFHSRSVFMQKPFSLEAMVKKLEELDF